MKLVFQILFGGSALLSGAILGVNVGLKEGQQHGRSALVYDPHSRSFVAAQQQQQQSSGGGKDPLAVLVMSVYDTVTRAAVSVRDAAASAGVVIAANSLESSRGAESRPLSGAQLLLVLAGGLGLAAGLALLFDTFTFGNLRSGDPRADRNNDGEAGDGWQDPQDFVRLDNVRRADPAATIRLGRAPPANYSPPSIVPAAENDDGTAPAAAGEQSLPLCVICCSRARDTVISPCGHCCMCWRCGQALVQHTAMTTGVARVKCPVCRGNVQRLDYLIVA